VDAVGVGVDRLGSREGREIFERFFRPIRSWTVRSRACKEALLELGVPEDRVAVGADWAWLYRPRRDLRSWGAGVWREMEIDLARPLLVANVVNEMWASQPELKSRLAAAVSELSERHGFQIAFFCNEMRGGEYFDFAAASEVRSRMTAAAAIVPNQYWSPDEALGLLGHATVTVSQRYHFTVESILAGTTPVSMVRGQKMRGLIEDLDLPAAGGIDDFSADVLIEQVGAAVWNRRSLLAKLQQARQRLELRAHNNLAFFRSFYAGS
jgi:polysaccharide pyruvyl transferase WcaK-like protein